VLTDDAWRRGHLNYDIVWRETDMSLEQLSAGIRELEIADLRQRTAIHAHYNDLLRAGCRRHGFGFVDSFTPFLGSDGVVDPNYAIAEARGFDHHLDSRRTYDVLSNLIWEIMRVDGTPRHR
jgi:hypothetical protein